MDCVDIQIVDDNLVEGDIDEFFTVTLNTNDPQVIIGSQNSATVFIDDNDGKSFTIHVLQCL